MKDEAQILHGYNADNTPIYKTSNVNEIYNTPLTAQDVVTIINFANNSNESKKWTVIIEVYVDGVKANNNSTDNFLIQNIENKYKCDLIEIDPSTKIVNKVIITKI